MKHANPSGDSQSAAQLDSSFAGSIAAANPFASRFVRPDQMKYVLAADLSWEQLLENFTNCHWRGQIVGPHGSGKTTLMWNLIGQLKERFRSIRFVQLQQNASRLDQATVLFESNATRHPRAISQKYPQPDQLMLIDGFEQLNRWRRFQIRTSGRYSRTALLVSGHYPVGLPTILETGTSAQQFRSLVHSLCKSQMRFSNLDAKDLLERHQGNAREALFELYDVWEMQRDQFEAQAMDGTNASGPSP